MNGGKDTGPKDADFTRLNETLIYLFLLKENDSFILTGKRFVISLQHMWCVPGTRVLYGTICPPIVRPRTMFHVQVVVDNVNINMCVRYDYATIMKATGVLKVYNRRSKVNSWVYVVSVSVCTKSGCLFVWLCRLVLCKCVYVIILLCDLCIYSIV